MSREKKVIDPSLMLSQRLKKRASTEIHNILPIAKTTSWNQVETNRPRNNGSIKMVISEDLEESLAIIHFDNKLFGAEDHQVKLLRLKAWERQDNVRPDSLPYYTYIFFNFMFLFVNGFSLNSPMRNNVIKQNKWSHNTREKPFN